MTTPQDGPDPLPRPVRGRAARKAAKAQKLQDAQKPPEPRLPLIPEAPAQTSPAGVLPPKTYGTPRYWRATAATPVAEVPG
ncbi:hypothetical protein, partial [Clavibacter michiganensis]|uniref:hypothetical protein n=1 Tax=Clavibacter michiganensis TaxID=28447 RepID=UPI0029305E93